MQTVRIGNELAERFEERLFEERIDFHLDPDKDTVLTSAYIIERDEQADAAESIVSEIIGQFGRYRK
jgi:hypothetical protein